MMQSGAELVRLRVHSGIGVITLQSPPVNATSVTVRGQLVAALHNAAASRASDIDVVWLRVCEREIGPEVAPAPLLLRLAEDGRRLREL